MNRNKLKAYAPQARCEFIKVVTDRAGFYGLTAKKIEPVTEQGDVAVIGGKAFPKSVAAKRKLLEQRIARQGFEQVMEAMAYTWFNRFVAIRYMELHGYLDHGYRVLSNPDGSITPEIVEHAEHVDLPGLKKEEVIELKLEGNREAELYRIVLLAQCHALHQAMPFLFEPIDDETELLLPENLLHSDSVIRKLVAEIPEEDWQEVEIIGWLYQFYISKKKDQVIGKVVKSEDIPAATQLFTPNWIVKYLVQNSLGRQWVATYPDSPLKAQMEYYIEPAEQTPEVQEQLAAITPKELNPEELTLLDPACGSGHILVEAYDLLKSIYLERGYRAKDIPRLILEKNLYGLEIDDRAAQLAAFALMMKAREDDRRIFAAGLQPQVLAIQESKGLDAREIAEALNQPIFKGEAPPPESLFEEIDDEKAPLFSRKNLSEPGQIPLSDVAQLIDLFEHGKTFGSLIQVPEKLVARLPAITERVEVVVAHGGMFEKAVARRLKPLVEQARILAGQYDGVVANPPYMGSKYYTPTLKAFINKEYKEAKADLYACFMERNKRATKPSGFHGMINIPNWMFLSSFEGLRKSLFETQAIDTFVHNGRGVFGSDFGSCAFVSRKAHLPEYRGSYRRLFEKQGSVASNEELEARFHTAKTHTPSNTDFAKIPGSPVAYWIGRNSLSAFGSEFTLGDIAPGKVGMRSGDNARFLRLWHEVTSVSICLNAGSAEYAAKTGKKWFPFKKGGPFRKWYGNNDYVINWFNDGAEVKERTREAYPELGDNLGWKITNEKDYFRAGITWTDVSISLLGVRLSDAGAIFSTTESALFPSTENRNAVAGFLCSKVAFHWLQLLNPTLHFPVGELNSLPFDPKWLSGVISSLDAVVSELVENSRLDWDSFETSWDFATPPVFQHKAATLRQSQEAADAECLARFARMKELEIENNRLFIEAYGLQDELSPEVPDDQITLYRPNREEDIQRLISYAIGCMMGRYSLDEPGLIYAHSGNQGFDPSQYRSFPADDDGIIPITDTDWFPDDATNRFVEFIATAWPKEHLEENLKFVAESLGPKKGESPRDTIRRYLSQGFFKHHLSMYKKRPIYWLFSSGKQRAFECLVYLHRYNEGTLGRMRTEYVIPLQGKIEARIDQLKEDIASATSTAHGKRLQKERDKLIKQQAELRTFDEKLRHCADQRIPLDLDDGVKVNYGKFGDLLAEVKAITGGKGEE